MLGPKRTSAKLAALREQGTLHPHPTAVTDSLFQHSAFFDPRDVVQVKYEMLRRVKKEQASVSEAAAACGFSRPSFYQAQDAFARQGLAGLLPRKRGPRQAHKLTAEVIAFISELRGADPSLGAAELAQRVADRFGLRVHPRSIERRLVQGPEKKLR
jgi:transposase